MSGVANRDISVKGFLPSTTKITRVSGHPVQSWVAVVDKNSGAQIWNWKTGEILYTAQFGGIDESAMHYHSLQKMAEVDPAYWGAKMSQDQSVSKTPSGKLKMIEFMDVETLYWQRVSQLSITKGRAGEILQGNVPGGIAVQKERWLVFVCENKILFHELISHKSHELSKIALDSKNPTCVTVISSASQSSPLDDAFIAVGCSDGAIRLISFSTFKTVARLGVKSAPVTCLMAVHTSPTTTLLVSGTQEGNLFVWDPFPATAPAGGVFQPLNVTKAHDAEIISLALGYSIPFFPKPGLFTLGADRSIGVYEVPELKCLSKFRGPNQKTVFHSLDICQPLEASPDKCPVLIGAQNMIYGTSLVGGTYFKILDPSTMPTGLKNASKIYHFTLHPLQRQYLIMAMNAGVIVARIAMPFLSTTVSLPVPRTPKQAMELTCLRLHKQSLVQTEFMIVQQESASRNESLSVPEVVMDRELMLISDIFGSGGHYAMFLSPDCSKIAIVRTDQNRFIIVTNTGGTSWTALHQDMVSQVPRFDFRAFEGQGSALVWNATSDCVAVLDVPPASPVVTSHRTLGRLRSKADPSQNASNEPAPPAIKIYKLSINIPQEVNVGDNVPVMLHGGPLLGVTFAARVGNSKKAFMFYSWETLLECSDELEAPVWLAWSNGFDLCAFSYQTHILLFRIGELFHPLSALPVEDGVSGMWKGDLLYVATQSSIEVIVVQRSKQTHDLNAILSIQVIVLASFRNGPNWLTGMVESAGRAQKARPCGHLKILNASRTKVWVIDTHEQPATIDVDYPAFLALEHTIDEEYSAARVAAMGKLSADSLGQMFLTMGKRSAVEALKLPGLSLPLRLRTAIEARYLKHALLCLQAIASGCRRAEAVNRLPEFRETLKEENPTPRKSPTASGSPLSPFSGVQIPGVAPVPVVAESSENGIDWNAPLKSYTQKPPKKLDVELSREVLELGLALHDVAVDERMYTVADSAAALVIQHCNETKDGDLLIQLETKLSAREQTQQLKDLIALTEKSKKSIHGQLKGNLSQQHGACLQGV